MCTAPGNPRTHTLSPHTLQQMQLGGGGKSAIGEFMKNMRQQNDNFEEQLLKLVSGREGRVCPRRSACYTCPACPSPCLRLGAPAAQPEPCCEQE